MSWTQPICTDCWITLHPERVPTRVLRGEVETCSMCGRFTMAGIFFRRDPSTVPFPRKDEDDA